MRWEGNRESSNVEDARDAGGGGGFRLGGGSLGLGSVVIALVAGWIFGVNPLTIYLVHNLVDFHTLVWLAPTQNGDVNH